MKKLSILVALILCVTIGGVYATWTYAGSSDVLDVSAEIKVELENATLSGSIGSYSISSNFALKIDQKNNNHEAKLVFVQNNSDPIHLTIEFTPNDGADATVKENGINTKLTIATTTDMKYPADANGNYTAGGTEKAIFSIPTSEMNITWTKEGNKFVKTFNQAELESMILLNDPIILDTKGDHTAFASLLTGNIKFTVSDGVTTP